MKTYRVMERIGRDRVCRMTTTNKEEAELHCSWMRCHYRNAWIEEIED